MRTYIIRLCVFGSPHLSVEDLTDGDPKRTWGGRIAVSMVNYGKLGNQGGSKASSLDDGRAGWGF
jgi:hypothetical protein